GHGQGRPVLAGRDAVGDAPGRALLQGRQRARDHGRDRPLRHRALEPPGDRPELEAVRGAAPQPRSRSRAPLPRRLQGAAAAEPVARGRRGRASPAGARPAGRRAGPRAAAAQARSPLIAHARAGASQLATLAIVRPAFFVTRYAVMTLAVWPRAIAAFAPRLQVPTDERKFG